MSITLPERDWKYLKAIKDELLADLCRDINRTAAQILEAGDITDYDKYLKLYRHMENSDRLEAFQLVAKARTSLQAQAAFR